MGSKVGSLPACDDPSAARPPEPPRAYDVPPKLLFSPEPEYSKAALQRRVSGSAQVRLHVTSGGSVDGVEAICGVGYGLNEKAIEAGRQYRFRPAMKEGHAVACVITVSVNFQAF